jgi:hypothetical protein
VPARPGPTVEDATDELRPYFLQNLRDGSAATATFMAAIGATCAVLWNAHRLAPLPLAGASACVLAMLWLVGWISERGESARAALPAA